MATPPTRVSYNVPATGNYTSTTTPKTTGTFDVVSGDIIIVLAQAESATTITSVTPSASGGTVTWTARTQFPASANGSTSLTRCWTGAVGATATGITVSLATIAQAADFWGFSATLLRAHGGVGQVFTGGLTAGTGAPSVAVACSANSGVFCAVNDWNAVDGSSRVWRTINGSAETETLYLLSAGRHTAYGGYRIDTGTAATITQGLTAPATMRWSLSGVEILGTTSGTQYAASGTAASTSAAAGAVTLRAVAAGVAAAISLAAGTVTSILPATGTATSTSSAVGDTGALLVATGTAASTSTAAGAVTSLLPATGTAASTSAASGDAGIQGAAQTYPASGTATSTSTAVGSVTLLGVASGTAASTSAATGAATSRLPSSGTAASVSAAAGTVTSRLPATGTAVSTSTAVGDVGLLSGGALAAQGTAVSVSTATGVIQLRAVASGAAVCSSTAAGSPTARLIASGTAASTSTAAGVVTARLPASGTAASTSTATGSASIFNPSIPPLPTTGVSLALDAGPTRGLTLTGGARALEVTT